MDNYVVWCFPARSGPQKSNQIEPTAVEQLALAMLGRPAERLSEGAWKRLRATLAQHVDELVDLIMDRLEDRLVKVIAEVFRWTKHDGQDG